MVMSEKQMHQIFYNYDKFDSREKIDSLKGFMYNKETSVSVANQPLVKPKEDLRHTQNETLQHTQNEVSKRKEEPVSLSTPQVLYPDKKNALFWCIYIHKYGHDEYRMIPKSKQATTEIAENQKIINFIKENPKILKNTNKKITNAKIDEIQSDLMLGKTSNLSLLPAYSMFYKISIIVFFGNICYPIYYDDDHDDGDDDDNKDHTLCIRFDFQSKTNQHTGQTDLQFSSGKFGICDDEFSLKVSKDKLEEQYFVIDDFAKPLKSVSAYRLTELENIASKLQLLYTSKMKKSDLYVLISDRIKLFLPRGL
jgi:hypothetical protein